MLSSCLSHGCNKTEKIIFKNIARVILNNKVLGYSKIYKFQHPKLRYNIN